MDLRWLFEDVLETDRTIALNKKYYNSYYKRVSGLDLRFDDDDSFWVACKGKDPKSQEIVDNGYVRLSVTVLPKEVADSNKVGDARTEPNQEPYLPPPTGRLKFTLNPFSMLSQLLGPEIVRKLYMMCCLAVCIGLCIAIAPMIVSNIASSMVMKTMHLE